MDNLRKNKHFCSDWPLFKTSLLLSKILSKSTFPYLQNRYSETTTDTITSKRNQNLSTSIDTFFPFLKAENKQFQLLSLVGKDIIINCPYLRKRDQDKIRVPEENCAYRSKSMGWLLKYEVNFGLTWVAGKNEVVFAVTSLALINLLSQNYLKHYIIQLC